MTVANRIREIRKEKGITQKQLGNLCGIAESTIRRYELGLLNPKIETIQKIADALDVEIYELDERIEKLKDNYTFISGMKDEIEKMKLSPETSSNEDRFINQYSWWIKDAEKEISEIQSQIGNVNPDILFPEQKLLRNFRLLNERGKKEANKRVEELTEIIRYTEP